MSRRTRMKSGEVLNRLLGNQGHLTKKEAEGDVLGMDMKKREKGVFQLVPVPRICFGVEVVSSCIFKAKTKLSPQVTWFQLLLFL